MKPTTLIVTAVVSVIVFAGVQMYAQRKMLAYAQERVETGAAARAAYLLGSEDYNPNDVTLPTSVDTESIKQEAMLYGLVAGSLVWLVPVMLSLGKPPDQV